MKILLLKGKDDPTNTKMTFYAEDTVVLNVVCFERNYHLN